MMRIEQMRIARVDEIEERQLAADRVVCSLTFSTTLGVVKVGVLMPLKSWVKRSSSMQLGARHAHQLDAKAEYADIVDIGRQGRSRPAKRTQAGKSAGVAKTPWRKAAGRSNVDDEPAAHDAVGLGIAGALERRPDDKACGYSRSSRR